MTKNTLQRLAVFFIGIPLFVLAAVYLGFARHILLAALVIFLQVLMVGECASIFKAGKLPPRLGLAGILSIGLGASAYLLPLAKSGLPESFPSLEALLSLAMAGALILTGSFAFSKKESFPEILPSLASSLFVYFYCGVLGSFLVYIASGFDLGTEAVLTFTMMSFGNDSLAWLTGMTLGRKRGIVPVSPNKSLAGFIGGFLGSLAAAGLAILFFNRLQDTARVSIFLLGSITGAAVIVGDLLESALKRSAGIKDSSSLVPGRGGILDSFDSLLFSAPIFVILSSLLGIFNG